MNFLKNVPSDPKALAGLVDYEPHQVESMMLTRSEDFSIMLMAVADGEKVKNEKYPGDCMYIVLDGDMPLVKGEENFVLHTGDTMAIPASLPHAIGGGGAFKIMQIMVNR